MYSVYLLYWCKSTNSDAQRTSSAQQAAAAAAEEEEELTAADIAALTRVGAHRAGVCVCVCVCVYERERVCV
jgi:hypothetical protein